MSERRLYQIDTFDPEKPFIYNGICFDPDHGSGANGNTREVNYAGFVAFIKPQTFLDLAHYLDPRLIEAGRDFFVETLPKVDWCISPGTLSLQPKGYNPWGDEEPDYNNWEVSGHEGRHRATALQDLGVRLIPTFIFPLRTRSRDIDADFLATTNRLWNEDRNGWGFLRAKFFIIDKKVYVLASKQETADRLAKDWVQPLTIKTLAQKTPFDDYGETSYRYWSKPDPNQTWSRNPDMAETRIRFIEDEPMWWSSNGPVRNHIEFIPTSEGLAKPDGDPHLYEVDRWVEDIFEEVRQEVNPEAPSRLGNIFLCPRKNSGFCVDQEHLYQVSATGKSFTTDAAGVTNAFIMARLAFNKGWKDEKSIIYVSNYVRNQAKKYWLGGNSWGHEEETILEGTARIIYGFGPNCERVPYYGYGDWPPKV